MSEIIATYHFNKVINHPEAFAEKLAVGLTVGSWTDLTTLDQSHLQGFKGRVVKTEILADITEVTIGYPVKNVTPDFSSILTTVFGKLSLDGEVKLVELDLGDYATYFPGPAFGVQGVRALLKVEERPLVMSIFKGIIGRDVTFFRQQLKEQALGGVDIIKDDEILYDVPELPFEERIQAAAEVLEEVQQETGKRVLYAANLSGPVFQLPEKAKRAKELGATALLFNVHAYGLDVLKGLRELNLGLPIMAHPSFSGAISGSPNYGLSYGLLLSKLTQLAGADFILFPAPYGSVPISESEARRIVTESSEAFPVPSAGIHPGLVKRLIDDYGRDIVINAGGGVHGHPRGAAAGGQAFIEAIAAYDGEEPGIAYKEAIKLWGTS
ncbi:2,3-diketo-5-methylthiopentyl-1-phosphate enolase [Macrococcus hajekii]|uniref:2,3-diketo-5-methylthiopentyl-1-phosphate enolase n=1 Tax=Macrococcus hajekii TaxID=198482 RepID=A0A4R6BIB5_9STAP|nr:2,3-diketo-5-methylthiopentyl-1-phosphate enolase [Macrococcus hajekii]TDM01216.1 2,3-diketo-5-methylthiopentyl-1-phosphate enolase [Macrococcus hajekii]GGB11608.1 2,3-diketo-5-methylthiopentyl-1-phosphate enolase [Macrococcus hajekii]